MSEKNKVSQKSKKTAKTAVKAVKSKRTAVASQAPRSPVAKSKKVTSAKKKTDEKKSLDKLTAKRKTTSEVSKSSAKMTKAADVKKPGTARKQKSGGGEIQSAVASRPPETTAEAPQAKLKKVRKQGSAIISTGKEGGVVSSILRGHGDIAKGIAERKAAAKAKSIARLSRPAAEKNKHLKKLTPKQSKDYESMLLRLRDEISRQIAFLRGASLTRSDEVNPEEDGSDAFERQLALKLASNEGDAVFEIDEALQRIKEGVYGICQDCGCVISPARLKALPFARRCVVCKTVAEKDRSVSDRRYF